MGTRVEEVQDQPESSDLKFEVDPNRVIERLRAAREDLVFRLDMLNILLQDKQSEINECKQREQQMLARIAELEDVRVV